MKFHEFPKSSNIDGVHYDPSSQTMTVKFRNGGKYQYDKVDAKHWKEMQACDSVGKYLHKHVRNAHKWKRLDD